uniref:DUF38 domain-containing protein n=1 Tax=Panagrolaimus davidi TaxID=227884 RepID=A0A914PUZ5_9BILA
MSYIAQPFNLVSSTIPYFYRCDIKTSQICDQEITYDQFEFIFSKVEVFYLNNCVVRNKNDEIVPLEKLVKTLPKIEKIHFQDTTSCSSITSNTVKELLKIPHFSKITEVVLWEIPEKFDLETFYIYFKKNKHTNFRLHFADSLSEAYKILLEAIVDEIIAAENHGYKIPYFYFAGLQNEKWEKVDLLICQQNKQ